MISLQTKNQHLLWRAGFGPSVTGIIKLPELQPHNLYEEIEKQSLKKPVYITVANNTIKDMLIFGLEGNH